MKWLYSLPIFIITLLPSCNIDNSAPYIVFTGIQYKSNGICSNPQITNHSLDVSGERYGLTPLETNISPISLPIGIAVNLNLQQYSSSTSRNVNSKGYAYQLNYAYALKTPRDTSNIHYSFNLSFKCSPNRPEVNISIPASAEENSYVIIQEDASQPSGYNIITTQTKPIDWD